jgi:hypothetical protein
VTSNSCDINIMLHIQDTRLLLVISNFKHLSSAVIPSMLIQLEGALAVSVSEDRKVRIGFFFVRWKPC